MYTSINKYILFINTQFSCFITFTSVQWENNQKPCFILNMNSCFFLSSEFNYICSILRVGMFEWFKQNTMECTEFLMLITCCTNNLLPFSCLLSADSSSYIYPKFLNHFANIFLNLCKDIIVAQCGLGILPIVVFYFSACGLYSSIS